MSTTNIFEYFCNLLIMRVYNAQIVEFWNFVNLDISLILRIKTCIKQTFFTYFVRRKSEANGSVRIVWLSVLYIDMYFLFYSTVNTFSTADRSKMEQKYLIKMKS